MKARRSHSALAVAVAGIGVAIAVVVTLLTRGSERGPTCRAALIPAYVPPHELAALAGARPRPRMVVVNPASGPGAERSDGYAGAVRKLKAAGVRVLGYVPTGYGYRPLDAVRADVQRYLSWYHVDGIFFDEASSSADQLPYYRTAASAARDGGGRLVVLNPGVPPDSGYFDVADVVVTYEGTFADYGDAQETTPAWLRDEDPNRVANLIYDATRADALDARASASAGYVYATSGSQPNPWRTVSPYFRDETQAVGTCA
ncbi:MAG TPA: spherulation-specific family 4 protein [Baekduia sp.]